MGLATLWILEGRSLRDEVALGADRVARAQISLAPDSPLKASAWSLDTRVVSLLSRREENRRFIGYVLLGSIFALAVTAILLVLSRGAND